MFVNKAVYLIFVKLLPLYRHIAMIPKILIIDDDHDILLTARMFLEQLEFDVTVMSDPTQVLTRLSKEHFDVVLLDMNFQRGQTESR